MRLWFPIIFNFSIRPVRNSISLLTFFIIKTTHTSIIIDGDPLTIKGACIITADIDFAKSSELDTPTVSFLRFSRYKFIVRPMLMLFKLQFRISWTKNFSFLLGPTSRNILNLFLFLSHLLYFFRIMLLGKCPICFSLCFNFL
jgi:hypothetical protein